jgi:hypothetical protein
VEELRKQRLANRATRTSPRRSSRSAGKQSDYLSRAAIQEHVDGAMRTYHPALPRLLTNDKALGVLKKRVVALGEFDIAGFIGWAIQFWRTTASNHERSARKKVGDTQKYAFTPIPATPDFATLCYRFPYFLACYRSHVQAESQGFAVTEEAQLKEKVGKLERKLQAATEQARGAQERERRLRRRVSEAEPAEPPQAAPAPVIARIRRAPQAALTVDLGDDDIPEWDDHPVKTKARK